MLSGFHIPSYETGRRLEALGSVLIVTVMLTDRFLYTLQDGYCLACAMISAILLIVGIGIVKWRRLQEDIQAANAMKSSESRKENSVS